MISMTGARATTVNKMKRAATVLESRVRPPEFTLIMDCPIILAPPMVAKVPQVTLPNHWAMHSRFGLPLVPVISSINWRVIKDSTNPMSAIIPENGKMVVNSSKSKAGNLVAVHQRGMGKVPPISPPAADAKSFTVLVEDPINGPITAHSTMVAAPMGY